MQQNKSNVVKFTVYDIETGELGVWGTTNDPWQMGAQCTANKQLWIEGHWDSQIYRVDVANGVVVNKSTGLPALADQ